MDAYYSPKILCDCKSTESILEYLNTRRNWFLKNWKTMTDKELSIFLAPFDDFCWNERGLELKTTSKEIYQQNSWMDRYAPFYKCTGCGLIERLEEQNADILIRSQKTDSGRGRVVKSKDHLTLTTSQTNTLLSWYFHSLIPEHINLNLLTFNCKDKTINIINKPKHIDQVAITPDLVAKWFKEINHLVGALPAVVWKEFNKSNLVVNPATLQIQLSNFVDCVQVEILDTTGLTIINPVKVDTSTTGSTPIIYLNRFIKTHTYPCKIGLDSQNRMLYLLSLLSYPKVLAIVNKNPELLNQVKNFFRPSEFPEVWGLLKQSSGKGQFLKQLIQNYFILIYTKTD